MTEIPNFTLNNGVKIPVIGFGVYPPESSGSIRRLACE
jgi:diketogulonate reductase-like aldo/keto reductase